jgi:hypothetical protein
VDGAGTREEINRHVFRLIEMVLSKEHPFTTSMPLVLSHQGKHKQAEEMDQQALRLMETVLGKEHLDTLTSVSKLAESLSKQGQYMRAEETHREALRMCEMMVSKENPDTPNEHEQAGRNCH